MIDNLRSNTLVCWTDGRTGDRADKKAKDVCVVVVEDSAAPTSSSDQDKGNERGRERERETPES